MIYLTHWCQLPKMDQSMLEIFNYRNPSFFKRLLSIAKAPIFYGKLPAGAPERTILAREFDALLVKSLKEGLPDAEIYSKVQQFTKSKKFNLSDEDQNKQAKYKADALFKYLEIGSDLQKLSSKKPFNKPFRILDFGCSDGSLSVAIGAKFNLALADIFGIDVKEPTKSHLLPGHLLLVDESARLPFENATFDLITCLMTLHHVQQVEATLKEFHRVLKPTGRILLKEHNLSTVPQFRQNRKAPQKLPVDRGSKDEHIMTLVLNAQHSFYDRVWMTEEIGGMPLEDTKYHSIGTWDLLFEEAGFVPLELSYYDNLVKNPANKFVRVYGLP